MSRSHPSALRPTRDREPFPEHDHPLHLPQSTVDSKDLEQLTKILKPKGTDAITSPLQHFRHSTSSRRHAWHRSRCEMLILQRETANHQTRAGNLFGMVTTPFRPTSSRRHAWHRKGGSGVST